MTDVRNNLKVIYGCLAFFSIYYTIFIIDIFSSDQNLFVYPILKFFDRNYGFFAVLSLVLSLVIIFKMKYLKNFFFKLLLILLLVIIILHNIAAIILFLASKPVTNGTPGY